LRGIDVAEGRISVVITRRGVKLEGRLIQTLEGLPDRITKSIREHIVSDLQYRLEEEFYSEDVGEDDRRPTRHFAECWNVTHGIDSSEYSYIRITNNQGYEMVMSHPRGEDKVSVMYPSGNVFRYAMLGNEPSGGGLIYPNPNIIPVAKKLKFWSTKWGRWFYKPSLSPSPPNRRFIEKFEWVLEESIEQGISDYREGRI
jgi:hypothetical protein